MKRGWELPHFTEASSGSHGGGVVSWVIFLAYLLRRTTEWSFISRQSRSFFEFIHGTFYFLIFGMFWVLDNHTERAAHTFMLIRVRYSCSLLLSPPAYSGTSYPNWQNHTEGPALWELVSKEDPQILEATGLKARLKHTGEHWPTSFRCDCGSGWSLPPSSPASLAALVLSGFHLFEVMVGIFVCFNENS